MTLPMNKFTNVVIPTYFEFIQMPIIDPKFGKLCILAYFVMNILSWMISSWMTNNSVSDNICNIVNSECP